VSPIAAPTPMRSDFMTPRFEFPPLNCCHREGAALCAFAAVPHVAPDFEPRALSASSTSSFPTPRLPAMSSGDVFGLEALA
jgi:hypothetical protein